MCFLHEGVTELLMQCPTQILDKVDEYLKKNNNRKKFVI